MKLISTFADWAWVKVFQPYGHSENKLCGGGVLTCNIVQYFLYSASLIHVYGARQKTKFPCV